METSDRATPPRVSRALTPAGVSAALLVVAIVVLSWTAPLLVVLAAIVLMGVAATASAGRPAAPVTRSRSRRAVGNRCIAARWGILDHVSARLFTRG